ncbi:hypothetical protein [Acinetobacter suaedae]|nr:hypothetical protein [Acinetobacter sp. C16S1]
MPKNVKQETYSTLLNCLKIALKDKEKALKVTVAFKKRSLRNKKKEKGLCCYVNAVECTSIGGDADKNLLINKDLA